MEPMEQNNQGLQLSQVKDNLALRSFTTWTDDGFPVVINACMFKLGLKQQINIADPLGRLEMDSIFNFVKRYFAEFKFSDIDEAFDCYCAGNLQFWNNGKLVESIWDKQFDNGFIGKVLSSFRKFKVNEGRTNRSKDFKAEEITPLLTEEQMDLHIKEAIKDTTKIDIRWSEMYDYMIKHEILKELSKEDKILFAAKVKSDIQQEIEQRNYEKKSVFILESKLKSKIYLGLECRKQIVIDYFQSKKLI